ncbi:MAG: hypothetical protein NXY57DRAFT_962278 [Lentinula lateritia]|nr:MAG: hypothetical protein NXY57DRAFT_962278 [Lentinula lateritia]
MSISENLCMPTNDTLIIAFIGFHMGASWPANSRLIRFARAGARIAGASQKQPQRNPITLAHLLALYSALDFSIPFQQSHQPLFWGCCRLGKLTIPSKNKFDPKYHVSRSATLNFAKNPDHSRKSVSFKIPWTKTTKELGASVVGTAQHHSLQTSSAKPVFSAKEATVFAFFSAGTSPSPSFSTPIPSPSSSTSSSLSTSLSSSSSSLSMTLLRFFNNPDGPGSGNSGGVHLLLAASVISQSSFQLK